MEFARVADALICAHDAGGTGACIRAPPGPFRDELCKQLAGMHSVFDVTHHAYSVTVEPRAGTSVGDMHLLDDNGDPWDATFAVLDGFKQQALRTILAAHEKRRDALECTFIQAAAKHLEYRIEAERVLEVMDMIHVDLLHPRAACAQPGWGEFLAALQNRGLWQHAKIA